MYARIQFVGLGTAGLLFCTMLFTNGARVETIDRPAGRQSVMTGLRVGQKVTLKDVVALYEIRVLADHFPGTHTITEIDDQYLALEEVTRFIKLRIPVTSIRAIVFIKEI